MVCGVVFCCNSFEATSWYVMLCFVVIRLIGQLGATRSGKIGALTRRGVDISSNSWGGVDGVFQGPNSDEVNALKTGVKQVRLLHVNTNCNTSLII